MKKILSFCLLLCALVVHGAGAVNVFVLEIRSDIDPRMSRYVELALAQATEQNADYVIIDMDTYGGALNDADDIRTRILEYPKPVWVFINKDAASAGALISIACDSIYMAPGASIGAATVVTGDGAAAPDKYQSYMRSMMRTTAESNGRDPRVAEAMVDERMHVEGVIDTGQVLTLTADEALKLGYCEAKVSSIDEILARNGLADAHVDRYELSVVERIIAIFLNPFISGILILVIIGGIYFELQSPGIGFPLLAAIVAAVLYFVPYYLNGLAANWELLAFVIGLGLIAVEVFVIPGFGVAGIAGIVLTFGSLLLMMIGNDYFDFGLVPVAALQRAGLAVVIGLFGSLGLLVLGGFRLAHSRAIQRIALQDTFKRAEGYTSSFYDRSLVGKVGEAHTVLRPSGKIRIDGNLYDAYTRGEYIDRDQPIVVISDEGTSLRVRMAAAPPAEA
ncbi:membrane-bound serine protease (ClpP class) [Catalinimonas alkaloidigena]|uniref:Membrane-bound serine protease (ClpP class) n=1 Tax=Catalinimonas alkaloidigena TaxID=1075417 RepID=A0A1G8X820_9BACT|nr:NfeD family protein [Catalinimonas alkaloidigena]SDJ86554.1 membrane-bound serine protease (ClpP class) [Catalinimonas alkaloidigena]